MMYVLVNVQDLILVLENKTGMFELMEITASKSEVVDVVLLEVGS
jgi:hypothetical protein